MSRPKKNYCDYFPHSNNMRNHKKIKAIRNKFQNGYAIWSMLLEYITGSDGNVFEYTELEFELIAGDFGFDTDEIKSVIDFCIKIELLFINNGWVNSASLDENLKCVYDKRNISKELSAKQKRLNGKYVTEITQDTIVSVTEIPQIKLNKTKSNKIKLNKTKLEKENSKIKIFDESFDEAIEQRKNNLKEILLTYFDEKYVTKSNVEKVFKLTENYEPKLILQAIKNAKNSTLWSQHFLSPAKLCTKDKIGVMYIDKFLKINENGKTQQSNYDEHKQRIIEILQS